MARNVVGTKFQQQQVSHDRDGYRALDALWILGDLMLAQTGDTLEFLEQEFYRPPPAIHIDDLP